MKPYLPARGDVVWTNFSPQIGHEQAGHHPAVVLSPESYNAKTGLMIACPITAKSKGYPFEVALSLNDIDGCILTDQIHSIDWRTRGVHFAGTLPNESLSLVFAMIGRLLT